MRWCSGRDSNSHGLLHTPLKRARLPITPPEQIFKKQDLRRPDHFVAGATSTGAATGAEAGEATGASVGVAALVESGVAVLLFVSAGASGLLDNTDTFPVRAGIDNKRADTINNPAAAIVTFDKIVAVPRGASAELETLLVNNAPASVLPGCSKTAAISTMHERKKIVYKKYSNFLNHLFIVHDRGKTFRIETSSADKCPVDIRLRHKGRNVVRLDRTAVKDPDGVSYICPV